MAHEGLSPLARRNRQQPAVMPSAQGSISARAEEPSSAFQECVIAGVYLRSRGGTAYPVPGEAQLAGLSPLARRNHYNTDQDAWLQGSISARAEEPSPQRLKRESKRVYLRSRGGTSFISSTSVSIRGLSPLARRNLAFPFRHGVRQRSISARAEEPCRYTAIHSRQRVYLRSRGGTARGWQGSPGCGGLSPLARRNLLCVQGVGFGLGSISARAEEPGR